MKIHVQAVCMLATAFLMGVSTIVRAWVAVPTDRTITRIGSWATGAYIDFSPAVPGAEGCSYAPGNEVYIDWSSNPDAKVLYASALAAYTAGQKVGFGLSGCSTAGTPVVQRIDVQP